MAGSPEVQSDSVLPEFSSSLIISSGSAPVQQTQYPDTTAASNSGHAINSIASSGASSPIVFQAFQSPSSSTPTRSKNVGGAKNKGKNRNKGRDRASNSNQLIAFGSALASSFYYPRMIASLQYALTNIDRINTNLHVTCSLKIGIRNLRSLLVCLRKLGDEGEMHIKFLCPGLEFYTKKLNHHFDSIDDDQMVADVHKQWTSMVAYVDQLSNGWRNQSSLLLEADEVLSIIDGVLENTADFLSAASYKPTGESTDAFEVLEAFGVQMRFNKQLLLFAIEAGVQSSSLLPHIQPIAINAASVFTQDNVPLPSIGRFQEKHFFHWFKELESKCLALNWMAADPQVHQVYAQALIASRHALTLPKDDDDDDMLKALLDSFISLLWDMLRHQSESRVKEQFKALYARLRFCRSILKKNAREESIRGEIVVLICDAGAFIFLLHQTDPGRFSDLIERFDVFETQFELEIIPSSMVDVNQVSAEDSTSINLSDDGKGRVLDINPVSSHQHPHSSLSQVVGFKEDEFQPLVDRLKHGTTNSLRIVPICGMPGLGKTTLALKLYNHPPIMDRFQARAWCSISQVLDKQKVLIQLLSQILPGDYTKETEDDLANKLRQSLKRKRYLIMLDDIWSADAWDSLKASFPDDSICSRIIITSRCLDIVPQSQPEEQPHLLRLRSDSECFEILQTKVVHKESWSTEVTEIVKEIVEKCNGLPLTVTLVAGLLATSEQESWKGIMDHLRSGTVSGGAEHALELSYRHLPDYLKPCFLYFGAFPEDEEVPVKRLIRLWMAEGFVRKGELKTMEDIAREYVEKLIERSLVMAVKGRSIGGISSCRVHDTVHDFCRSKAKQENLFHLLLQSHDQLSDFNEPSNLQRLFIHSLADRFKEARLFCPRAQSILFFTVGVPKMDADSHEKTVKESRLLDMSFITQISQTIKVLDIHQIYLWNGIPSDIGRLTELRYLAIKTHGNVIPSSFGNLFNLETFIAYSGNFKFLVQFPDNVLWNLQKLRYIRMVGSVFTLPIENLDSSSSLLELETMDGVYIISDDSSSMEKVMKKFPNIRTLKCTIEQKGKEKVHKIVITELPTQLVSLAIQGGGGVKIEFSSSAQSLLKLKLEGVEMSREDIAVIGKFPNLEVLILSRIYYPENILEMEEDEFVKLRILKVDFTGSLEVWTCSDEQKGCLEILVIGACPNLKEIPTSWLEDIPTLEQIHVIGCSRALESAVRNIEQVRKDYGNWVQPFKYLSNYNK